MRIRRARPEEWWLLRETEIASKAHWGYGAEFMARFARVVSMSPDYVRQHDVWILEDGTDVVGFYGLVRRGQTCELDHLWLLPSHIGSGHGRRLFDHAVARARELGAGALEWEAEPHALGFYRRMGARHLRWTVSQLGRRVSVMGVRLDNEP